MEVKQLKDELLGEFERSFKGLREEIGTKLTDADGYTKEQLEKANERMNALELKLQRARLGGESGMDLGERKRDLYARYLRKSAGDITPADVDQSRQDFRDYLRKGDEARGLDLKTLRTDSNADGGYLVEPEFDTQIIKDLLEISPVRDIVRVRQVSSNSFRIPVRNTVPSAQWLGETQQDTLTNSTYGLEDVPNGTLRATSAATREELEDAAFDVEGEIRADFSEQFAFTEGEAVVTGNGVGKPAGFMEDARVTSVITGDASNITYEGIINLAHGLNINYLGNARFVLNLATLGDVRLLEDASGELIYKPGIADVDNTIIGFPYTLLQAMPDVGAGNEPIAFGDFRRGYTMVDRVAMSMLRDPFTGKRTATVEFTAYRRVGGQVVLPSAIRKQTVST